MTEQEILSHVDHTLLSPTATWQAVRQTCDEGMRYGTATVCLPPCYVAQAADYVAGRLPICTVIGFPNGYSSTAAKCFEAKDAVAAGATEIDMVIRLGWAKEGRWLSQQQEIQAVKEACQGRVLKVIVETCLLTQEEKRQLCDVVSAAGADYIKTSTGFSKAGATMEDVALFAACLAPGVKIKAAGGIRDMAEAEAFLRLGAQRLGTSRLVAIQKQRELEGGAAQ